MLTREQGSVLLILSFCVGSMALHYHVARIIKRRASGKVELGMPLVYGATLLLSTLARILLILAVFGSFKALGEFLKLNGVIQQMRVVVGGSGRYAHNYYLEQMPYYANSSKDFTLRRSWSTIGYPSVDATWEELLTFRVQRMAELLEQDNTLDFLIEKDKCYMYDFFKSQAIPYVDILSFSSNIDAVTGSLRALLNKYNTSTFNTTTTLPPAPEQPPEQPRASGDSVEEEEAKRPGPDAAGGGAGPRSWASARRYREVYVKACHLTQGSDNGTLRVSMAETSESTMRDVSAWVRKKFHQKPSDYWRPWSVEMNKLLAVVRPGVMIQRAFDGPNGDAIGLLPKPIEAKVEVIWGRAYLAFLHDYKVFALRNGKLEKYQGIHGERG